MICAVGANVASVIWYCHRGEIYITTAGASGAVFAVAGMLLILVILHKGKMEGITLRRLMWMLIFTVYHGITEQGVNNCAHIAGAFLGMACGLLFVLLNFVKRKRTIGKENLHEKGIGGKNYE